MTDAPARVLTLLKKHYQAQCQAVAAQNISLVQKHAAIITQLIARLPAQPAPCGAQQAGDLAALATATEQARQQAADAVQQWYQQHRQRLAANTRQREVLHQYLHQPHVVQSGDRSGRYISRLS